MRRVLPAFALMLGCLCVAVPAFAHNTFVGSDPQNGVSLRSSPAEARVTFGQPVQEGDNEIVVLGPDGHSQWQRRKAATVDGESVHVPLRELGPAGRYTIAYRIISADGHPVSGTARFTLTEAGHGTPAPRETGERGGGGGIPVWVWLVLAVVVLGAGTGAAMRLNRPASK